MKAKFMNEVHLEGLLYEHDLVLKVTGPTAKSPNTEFISGTVKIATDPELLNIVEVHYTYVTSKTARGDANSTFTNLRNIIDEKVMTYMIHKGEDYKPTYVKVDTAIGLNDFYMDRNGVRELVTAKRNEGGFLHFIKESELSPDMASRNRFQADMVITSIRRVEADEEKNLPEVMRVKGVVFDFRKAILPVEFVLYSPEGMDLFEDQVPSSSTPFCTNVRGSQISQTTTVRTTEASAFGPAIIKESPRTRKEHVIESIFDQVSYVWDDDSFITADDLRKAMGDREVYLAGVKKRDEEYQASKANKSAATTTSAPASIQSQTGGFNF